MLRKKGSDQLCIYCAADPAQLICAFVFAYAKIRFSHEAAQRTKCNLCLYRTCCKLTFEPRHDETNVLVSDPVRHKRGCTATKDG